MSLWWACIKRIDSKPSRTHSIDWLTQLTRLTYSTHFWNRSRAFRSPSSLCFSRMVLLDSIDSIKLNFSYKVHRMKNEWILEIRSYLFLVVVRDDYRMIADHQRRCEFMLFLLFSRSSIAYAVSAVSAVQCRSMPYSHNSPQENEWMHNHNKQRGTQQSNSKDRTTRTTNTLKNKDSIRDKH